MVGVVVVAGAEVVVGVVGVVVVAGAEGVVGVVGVVVVAGAEGFVEAEDDGKEEAGLVYFGLRATPRPVVSVTTPFFPPLASTAFLAAATSWSALSTAAL